MRLNTSLIGAAVIAILSITSVESVGFMNFFKKDYRGQRLGKWNAFSQEGLKFDKMYFSSNGVDHFKGKTKINVWSASLPHSFGPKESDVFITCVDLNSLQATALKGMYPEDASKLALINYTSKGHFSFSIPGKKCYVSNSVCNYALSKEVQTKYSLGDEHLFNEYELRNIIESIKETIRILSELNIAYAIDVDNVSFNFQGNVVLLRYDNIKPLNSLDPTTVGNMDKDIDLLFEAMCKKAIIPEKANSYEACKDLLKRTYEKTRWIDAYLTRQTATSSSIDSSF